MVNTDVADERHRLISDLSQYCRLLSSSMDDEVHVQVRPPHMATVTRLLKEHDFHLVTVIGNDERQLEDHRFKIYYVFSHPHVDLFLTVEYLLSKDSFTYDSIYEDFPAVDPFELEMRDMLGLSPASAARSRQVPPGSWLHGAYPADLAPLQRGRSRKDLEDALAGPSDRPHGPRLRTSTAAGTAPQLTVPVGPIHADICESGRFVMGVDGENVRSLTLGLGYLHRGIERMFQSEVTLLTGWRLAEQVCGDSSFAHSLAYCRAVETLTETQVPDAAETLRTALLELERIHNHVANVGALADDVGLELFAAEFAALREPLLRLNKRITGHRYLRGVNRPGGLALDHVYPHAELLAELDRPLRRFAKLANALAARAGFRERTRGVGILTVDDVRLLGVTGLIARASGVDRDSRRDHPTGAYADPAVGFQSTSNGLSAARATDETSTDEGRQGDVLARFIVRVREVSASHDLIANLAHRWPTRASSADVYSPPSIRPKNNFTSALGHAEGSRGDVVYWVMQDKMGGIYRCKVRDPSMLNWSALPRAMTRRRDRDGIDGTLLADFPLVNRSFGLSQAGNDL